VCLSAASLCPHATPLETELSAVLEGCVQLLLLWKKKTPDLTQRGSSLPAARKKKRAPLLCLPTLIYSPLSLASDLPSCCTTGGSPQIVQISLNNTKQISAARTFAAQRVTSTVVAPDDSSATQTDSVPHRL
jgi:hypothetical protein